MSAPTPVSTPAAAAGGDPRPYEPSMEEILASIRRIIADDQSLPGRSRGEPEPGPSEEPPPSVHVLRTEEIEKPVGEMALDADNGAMIAQGLVAAPQFAGPDGPMSDTPSHRQEQAPPAAHLADLVAVVEEREPDAAGRHAVAGRSAEDGRATAMEPAATLLSATTNNAVSSAFNVLAASRLADNSTELLGMTREMVRPLLRAWLDENLPALVERLVRDEIERVARGGR